AAVAAVDTTLPVKFPNAPFKLPENLAWLSFQYLGEESFTSTIGNAKRVRHVGGLQFELHAPPESGTGLLDDILEVLVDRFQNLQELIANEHQLTLKEFAREEFDHEGRHRTRLRVAYTRDVTRRR